MILRLAKMIFIGWHVTPWVNCFTLNEQKNVSWLPLAASSNNYPPNSSAFGRDLLSILVKNIIVRKMKQKILVITLCFVIAFLHPHDLVAAASTFSN